MQKRNNPFSTPLAGRQPVEEPKTTVVEEEIEEEVVEPVRVQKVVKQPVQRYKEINVRNKFTATMDESLRREIKIYCATNGLMFSEFIEEACRNYLAKGSRR